MHLDEKRLAALAPDVDAAELRDHLQAFEKVSAGAEEGGPIASLSRRERFRWLVAPGVQ